LRLGHFRARDKFPVAPMTMMERSVENRVALATNAPKTPRQDH
jgi:hypothetical protein